MKLKIFLPDLDKKIDKKNCAPLLHPFITNDFTYEQRIEKYGEWITDIEIVDSIESCNIIMPARYINYYYHNKKQSTLQQINKSANDARKLTICFTNGDWGLTPQLKNFHLYRYSGYLSKNEGNEFLMPFFLNADPLQKFYGGKLPVHAKPEKPVIGFCGRASTNQLSSCLDIAKNIRRAALKIISKWHEDIEWIYGTSFKRFKMLQTLKNSDLVETNFICYKEFQGGGKSKQDKEILSKRFYQNMRESDYVFCYRGWGNYSIRFYETLAAGRIPLIITSDNNLPFNDEIDWSIFPVIDQSNAKHIAQIVASFHSNLSNDAFIDLQYKARKIWEEFLTYKGFIQKLVNKYST